jgi:hypothetical protein
MKSEQEITRTLVDVFESSDGVVNLVKWKVEYAALLEKAENSEKSAVELCTLIQRFVKLVEILTDYKKEELI